MEAFETTFDDYYWLAHAVQDTLLIVYDETNKVIFEKINSILKVLNIDEKQPDKFFSRFRTFFQEYFMSIFIFTDEIMLRIKSRLYDIILKYKNCPDKISEGIKNDAGTKSFKNMCQILFKLCIYMILHEPKLTLSIHNYDKREFNYNFFNKLEHLNIEGFGNDQSVCITILEPPMIRNYLPFQGIKPCVYIVNSPTQEMLSCSEKNRELKKTQQKNKEKDDIQVEKEIQKTEKSQSPVKVEKKSLEGTTNKENNSMKNQVREQQSQISTQVKYTSNSGSNNSTIKKQPLKQDTNIQTLKENKPQTNYMKYNKNMGKDIVLADNLNKHNSNNNNNIGEQQTAVNQIFNHPLSLNKKKFPTEKGDFEEYKSNTRLLTQNNKNSSKNSSKSCSLNTSLKNDALKLSEISDPHEGISSQNNNSNNKNTQRQNSTRTTLNTIDQPLIRELVNTSKNLVVGGNQISMSRKKNMLNTNKEEDFAKPVYPLKYNFDKQNTLQEMPSRMIQNPTPSSVLLANQGFTRKKTSITPENDSKVIYKDGENLLKKSFETNSASNLIKKMKNPLDSQLGSSGDKNRQENQTNVNPKTNDKAFSSTVSQKKNLNLGLKMNKNFAKADSLHEGPHTNRYDYSDTSQDQFFNPSDYRNTGKNFVSNNDDHYERNKVFSNGKTGSFSNTNSNAFKVYEEKPLQQKADMGGVHNGSFVKTNRIDSFGGKGIVGVQKAEVLRGQQFNISNMNK